MNAATAGEQTVSGQSSFNIPTTSKPRMVIVGGGFAGLELVRGLRHWDAHVILIDKNNHHTFQPLLYQVATAGLEAESIAYPFREIFRGQKNCLIRMAEVRRIDPAQNTVQTSIGSIEYDYLVIASGSHTNYFGMQDFQEHALPMKSLPEALAIRNLVLENMEKALLAKDLEERERLMNVVIIGGGPTGVEMAGAMGELKLHVLPKDYPELDVQRMQIHIIDQQERLLHTMSQTASGHAAQCLKKFDVNLWLKTKVLSYDGRSVVLSNGKKILSDVVIWAAGVAGSVLPGFKPELIAGGRLTVDAYNRVNGYENIFALGDAAVMITPAMPKGHPMLAPVAIQQAKNLADNLDRMFNRRPLSPFVYQDPGVMATIGRNKAVVDLKWLKFNGFLAWTAWLFVHLMALVGFRNKLVVFVNWAWSYFSYDRGLRLIIKPVKK